MQGRSRSIMETHEDYAPSSTFFQPDMEFVKWIIEYANDRMIIDVGCGNLHLLKLIQEAGYRKIVGIDPMFEPMDYIKYCLRNSLDRIQVLPNRVTDSICKSVIGAKADLLILCVRPCHSDFVEETIELKHPGAEVLYITVPENLIEYRDLGAFHDIAVKVEHRGASEDMEVVYSVK